MMTDALFTVLSLALFVPAIVVHEVAHGYVSYRLGDPTAAARGRLSLNPLKHVDPFGTVILPLLLAASGLPVFGYAKPVPIDPRYYRDYRQGMLLSGLAGPAANLLMATVSGLAFRAVAGAFGLAGSSLGEAAFAAGSWAATVLVMFAYINLVLMFFNLIPMPPLDGSRVLPLFLSDEGLRTYASFERYGVMVFFIVLMVLPRLLNVDLIGGYFRLTVDPTLRLLTGAAL
jgi:Zn-dependent protease